MTPRDWRGPVALVLAVGLAVGWAGAVIAVAVRVDMNATTLVAGPTILATVAGVMAAGVLTVLRDRPSDTGGDHLPRSRDLPVLPDDP